MSTDDVVILSGCRTPIGSFGGAFKDVSAVDLAHGGGRRRPCGGPARGRIRWTR
jgi:hypothetical protein